VPDFDYDLIESIEQLRFFAERLHAEVALGRRFGFDIETGYEGEDREKAQLHPEEGLVAGISLGACESSGTIWGRYAALNHDAGPNLDNAAAAEILWRLLITGYGVPHNASFEIRFLALWFTEHLADHPELGPEVRRRKGYIPVYSDTMIEAFVEAKFKSSKHRSSSDGIGSEAALKPLTQETFGHQMTEIFELFEAIGGKELTKKQKNSIRFNVLDLTGPHRRMIIDYVCEDAVWALAHHYKRYPEVAGNLIFQLEMDVIPCVVEMDAEGIVFDWQTMRETAVKATDFAGALREEILGDLTVMRNEAGIEGQCQINLGSPPQLAKVLYEELGMPAKHKSRKTGNPSTDKIAMKELSLKHEVIKKILTWRGLRKLVTTWLEVWPVAFSYAPDGRAHPHFIQTAVSAGRFAATDPAIMTAPKEYHLELATGQRFDFNFRDLVICPPGWYGLGWDYSQIELRVLAGEAGETVLAEAYARGDDVHSLTASRMLGIPLDQVDPKTHRQTGKTLNFAMNYQMGVDGLADRLGISKDEAQELYDAFFAGYPMIKRYMDRCTSSARREGCVWTRLGRKVVIWEYDDPKVFVQAHGDRVAGNAPIQGGAADYMKVAMVRARAALRKAGIHDKVRVWLNMHDALEFYVHGSLSPLEVVRVLQPAVVWTHPLIAHWPPMVADWHVWDKWGSPRKLELDFGPDGSVAAVTEDTPAEAPLPRASWVIADPEEDEGPELDPVSPDLLRLPAVPAAPPPDSLVVIDVPATPEPDDFARLLRLVQSSPGPAQAFLSTPDGMLKLSDGCRIDLGQPEVALILRGAAVRIEIPVAAAV
jgi:DNA polymerase I-like protein with 3'-5' exonuclease and polymerase domains